MTRFEFRTARLFHSKLSRDGPEPRHISPLAFAYKRSVLRASFPSITPCGIFVFYDQYPTLAVIPPAFVQPGHRDAFPVTKHHRDTSSLRFSSARQQ